MEIPYRILEYDFTNVKQEEEKKITEPEKPKQAVQKQNRSEAQFTNQLVKDSVVNDSSLTQQQLANLNFGTKKDNPPVKRGYFLMSFVI